MSALEGKRFIVAGGAGFVGRGISTALLESGANVLVLCCNETNIKLLQRQISPELGERAEFLCAKLGTPDGDAVFSEKLKSEGSWTGAVASIGAWAPAGSLLDLDAQNLPELIQANLVSHIRFMQMVVPNLAENGQYIQINGVGMDKPIPNSGIISVFDAATHMLNSVVAEETLDRPVTIYTLALQNHVKGPEASGTAFTPDEVGKRVVQLLASDRCSHRHGRTLRWAHPWQSQP